MTNKEVDVVIIGLREQYDLLYKEWHVLMKKFKPLEESIKKIQERRDQLSKVINNLKVAIYGQPSEWDDRIRKL